MPFPRGRRTGLHRDWKGGFESQPATLAIVGPVFNWALLIQSGDVDHFTLQTAWRSQYWKVPSVDWQESWKLVAGPAGAFARSVTFLGWTVSSAFRVRTRAGITMDLREVAPSGVKWLALKDYEIVGWYQWAARPEVMPELDGPSHKDPAGAWLSPIRALLCPGPKAKRWVLDPLARAALRTAVVGGHFTQ